MSTNDRLTTGSIAGPITPMKGTLTLTISRANGCVDTPTYPVVGLAPVVDWREFDGADYLRDEYPDRPEDYSVDAVPIVLMCGRLVSAVQFRLALEEKDECHVTTRVELDIDSNGGDS